MTLKVVIGRQVKRISLQRFLTTKIFLFPDKVTKEDLLGLYENQLWLEMKAVSDIEFHKKFGSNLEFLSNQLKKYNFKQGLSSKTVRRLSKSLTDELDGFFVPRRNYGQWNSRFGSVVSLVDQQQEGTLNKHLPPEQYIGKGYGDKGTAQIPELDASPSWQEIARADQYYQTIRREIENEKDVARKIRLTTLLRQEKNRIKTNLERGRAKRAERLTAQAKKAN